MCRKEKKMEFKTFYEFLSFLGSHHWKFAKGGFTDLLYFDLKNKRIKNGKTILYEDGKIVEQTVRLSNGIVFELKEGLPLMKIDFENPYMKLEELYREFKYSIPSPSSEFSRDNFIPKRIEDFSFMEYLSGGNRQMKKMELEAFVMFAKFPWENEKHHYWQSKQDKQLVLYKEWSD